LTTGLVTDIIPGSINDDNQVDEIAKSLADLTQEEKDKFDAELKLKELKEFDKKIVQVQKQKRSNIMIHAYLCSFFQSMLVIMVFSELFSECEYYSVLS